MYKATILLLLSMWAGLASAGGCPDFFRFVDFGQRGSDGVLYRGGSLFRAEGFDGTMLVNLASADCLEVKDTATDGRGLTIPVVTSFLYEPAKTAIDLTELRVSAVDDASFAAENNAERHRERLKDTDAVVTRGTNFLCAIYNDTDISCQVVSPYPGNIALVAYCDATQCALPVMAIDKHITVKAAWLRAPGLEGNDKLTGAAIVDMVTQIHDFLSPLTSLNPG